MTNVLTFVPSVAVEAVAELPFLLLAVLGVYDLQPALPSLLTLSVSCPEY